MVFLSLSCPHVFFPSSFALPQLSEEALLKKLEAEKAKLAGMDKETAERVGGSIIILE